MDDIGVDLNDSELDTMMSMADLDKSHPPSAPPPLRPSPSPPPRPLGSASPLRPALWSAPAPPPPTGPWFRRPGAPLTANAGQGSKGGRRRCVGSVSESGQGGVREGSGEVPRPGDARSRGPGASREREPDPSLRTSMDTTVTSPLATSMIPLYPCGSCWTATNMSRPPSSSLAGGGHRDSLGGHRQPAMQCSHRALLLPCPPPSSFWVVRLWFVGADHGVMAVPASARCRNGVIDFEEFEALILSLQVISSYSPSR